MPFHQWSISETLTHSKSIYYACFHCYKTWNNFLGNSSDSGMIFTLQKKIMRIMAGVQPITSR